VAVYDGVRVLTWNLFHGRSVPPSRRELLPEFAAALASWEWDIAVLQEVPPWWPLPLAAACSAHVRSVLTSRNALLPLRHAIAVRWPDVIKSNGGGANAILVRASLGPATEHRSVRLALRPERRRLHAVRLSDGVWVGNLHLSTVVERAQDETRVAVSAICRWADGAPVVLGGDFNLRELSLDGFETAAVRDIDYVFSRGIARVGAFEVLDSGGVSDHPPLRVVLTPAAP